MDRGGVLVLAVGPGGSRLLAWLLVVVRWHRVCRQRFSSLGGCHSHVLLGCLLQARLCGGREADRVGAGWAPLAVQRDATCALVAKSDGPSVLKATVYAHGTKLDLAAPDFCVRCDVFIHDSEENIICNV